MKEFETIYEPLTEKSRNEELFEMLERGAVPTLPFELDELKRKFEELAAQQEANGVLLGEAMSDSSETWHDNAAADTINANSVHLTSQARAVVERLTNAVVIDYPSPEDEEATLGSLVHLSFGGDDPEPMLIATAVTTKVSEVYGGQVPDNCEVVTMTSPLGAVLVGAKAGQEITYEVEGRKLSVVVADVLQPDPSASAAA